MRKIVRLRWKKRLGPVEIAGQLGMPASTVHAVLVRRRVNPLSSTHVVLHLPSTDVVADSDDPEQTAKPPDCTINVRAAIGLPRRKASRASKHRAIAVPRRTVQAAVGADAYYVSVCS